MDIPLLFEQAGGFDSLEIGLIVVANFIGKCHDAPRVIRFVQYGAQAELGPELGPAAGTL